VLFASLTFRLIVALPEAAVLLLGLGLFSLVLFFVSPSFSLYLKMIFLMLNFVVLMGVQLFGMDFLLQGLHSLNPLHMATTFSAGKQFIKEKQRKCMVWPCFDYIHAALT
jgi:hypothetical protein